MKKLLSVVLMSLMLIFVSCTPNEQKKDNKINTSTENKIEEKDTKKVTESSKDELILVEREINASLDSVQKYSVHYLRKVGALESLFVSNSVGSVVPQLAESAQEVDEYTWHIHLRDNAKYWSGKDVDAQSIIDSFNRSIKLSASRETTLLGLSFNAIDSKTLEIKTKFKHMMVPLILTKVPVYNADMDYTTPETTDYTGMYKIVEYIPKQKMVLKINDLYYKEKPVIPTIIYEEVDDAQTRIMAAISKRADIVTGVSPANADEIKNNPDLVLETSEPSGSLSIYINLQRAPYDDVRVRQALSWAVNRPELVEISSEGYGTAVSTWLGSNPLFKDQKNSVYNKYDIEKAGKLLDEAGYKMGSDNIREKDGKKLKFKLFTWGSEKVLGEVIQNQWTKLGVDVELNHVDYSIIQEARTTGDWDGLVETWNNYGDYHSILSGHFSENGTVNYGKYKSDATNELLNKLNLATTEEERHKIAAEINIQIAKDAPLIALMPRPNLMILNKKLKGFEPHFLQQYRTITEKLRFEE